MTSSVRNPEWINKVDSRLRALISRTGDHRPDSSQLVNLIIRFTGSVDFLQAHGVELRAVAGDIATVSVTLSDVPKIASIPEILFMELSRPLGPNSVTREN